MESWNNSWKFITMAKQNKKQKSNKQISKTFSPLILFMFNTYTKAPVFLFPHEWKKKNQVSEFGQ